MCCGSNAAEAHHHWRSERAELLGCGFQESHQNRDQQDVVPQGRLQDPMGRGRLSGQDRLQMCPERVDVVVFLQSVDQPAWVAFEFTSCGMACGPVCSTAWTVLDLSGRHRETAKRE